MDFIELVHKKEAKFNNPAVMAGVVLLILLITSFVVIKLWPKQAQQPILAYLPSETSFYFHFTESKEWGKDILVEYPLVDSTVLATQINQLGDWLGVSFLNSKEIVWFRVGQSLQDNYLLRISPLQKNVLQEIQEKYPNLYFKQLAKDTLLIASSEQLANSINEAALNDDLVVSYDRGINMYWQFTASPEFLEPLEPFLTGLFSSGEVKLNIVKTDGGQRIVNFYDVDASLDQDSFPSYKVPDSYDLALAFSQYTPDDIKMGLNNSIVQAVVDSFPYKNLSPKTMAEQILNGAVIFQRNDDWLLIFFEEPEAVILDFLDSFALDEVRKVLPDGTAYTELVVNPEQARQEIAFANKIYYQIANLYLYQEGQVNYLSNNQPILQEIIDKGQLATIMWSNCLPTDAKVGDFLQINSETLSEGPIKAYLRAMAIDKLQIASYRTDGIEGLQLCF